MSADSWASIDALMEHDKTRAQRDGQPFDARRSYAAAVASLRLAGSIIKRYDQPALLGDRETQIDAFTERRAEELRRGGHQIDWRELYAEASRSVG